MFICRKQNKILQNFCNYFVKYCKWISKRLRNPCTISRNLLFLLLLFKVDIFGFQQTLCRALPLSPSLSVSLSLFMLPAFTRLLLNSLLFAFRLALAALRCLPFFVRLWLPTNCKQAGLRRVAAAASAASLLNSFVSKDNLCTVLKLWSRVKWATVKRCQRREQQAEGGRRRGKEMQAEGWANKRGNSFPLARSLSHSLPLSRSLVPMSVIVCVCESGVWSVSVDCVQPQPRCWQLLGPLPLLNPLRSVQAGGRSVGRSGVRAFGRLGRKYCGNRLSCRQWLRCNNCYRAKSERRRERERECKDGCEVGSQLVYARKTCKKQKENRKRLWPAGPETHVPFSFCFCFSFFFFFCFSTNCFLFLFLLATLAGAHLKFKSKR